ncbi:alpha/beta hydrolase [Corynebacterium sputi]|uniref:alpha/beta hydrolase n=1 Tax=Corynebacterium sputi TaxID=489915 RepID=UPI0004177CC3|nr:alpha/beta hydrolase-fold protein [Corynebacterium sputi]
MKRFLSATLAAAAVALVSVVAVPTATANPTGCTAHRGTAVKCEVWSDAMDKPIPTVIRPSLTDNNSRVVQFFSGIDGGDGWSTRSDQDGKSVLEHLEDEDATLIFPTSDARSFFVDWDSPAPPNDTKMKYETFITEELPTYLEANFDVPAGGKGNTGLVGISMTGYSVVNLAAKHPDLYKSVLAMSGFYNTQGPIGRAATDLSVNTHGETNSGVPWDSEASRAEDNPWRNIDNLTMPVHMATATGIPHETDLQDYETQTLVEGGFLEAGTLVETAAWDVLSRLNGKSNVHITYIPTGIHAWNTWIRAAFTEQKLYWQFNQF